MSHVEPLLRLAVAVGFDKSGNLWGIFEFAGYWYGKAAPAFLNLDRRDAFATASASLRSKKRAEYSAAGIFASCGNCSIRAFGLALAPEAEPANIYRILSFRPALAQRFP
jgi:hypothetical protein